MDDSSSCLNYSDMPATRPAYSVERDSLKVEVQKAPKGAGATVQLIASDGSGMVKLPATSLAAATEVAEFFTRLLQALPALPRVVIPCKK